MPAYESTEEYLNSTQIGRQIIRIRENVSDALTAIGAKGVTVPSGSNSDDLATLIGAIQTGGGGSSAQVESGTVSGSGTIRLSIPCDFEPDLIYVYGYLTSSASLRGVVSIIIVKDILVTITSDGSQNNTDEYMYTIKHGITGYNESDSSTIHASYSDGYITIDTVDNTSSCRFASGVTYSYTFIKWT